ncbi:DNA polymerase III subunit tau [Paraliobacillus sp. PM-2]|uniref:DNA polymerase III subunit delta' n=1 Tax=Paraliobacillus sp. PM-2 TaxID=1462524 RepID=UPI00061BC714|nr:DNA polymerase III subunit delta' [Paraliobacillus sp. PM-2]CQR47503.1 DNA polymerase III subunit tau [Paraliobacillus sp. PM-2]
MDNWSQLETIQPIATKMVLNMIKRDRISHAYLFHGQKGIGKNNIATLLAKSIFCIDQVDGEPCHTCKNCIRISSGNHPDVHKVIPEGSSIKKDQILHLQKEFTYTGLESNRKVYIIQDADKMTVNAANRLLKFLEEPSKKTTAILLTKNVNGIIHTIRSRCQVIALQPLNEKKMQVVLQDAGITQENARLFSALTNNVDDAKVFDQDEWFAQARNLVVQLVEMLQYKNEEVLLFIHKQWMPHFSNREQLQLGLDLLVLWYKDIMYLLVGREDNIIFKSYIDKIEKSAMYWSKGDTTHILYAMMEAKKRIEQNVHPTLLMEQLTLRMQR